MTAATPFGCRLCRFPHAHRRLCLDTNPEGDLRCTRQLGHSGPHKACGHLEQADHHPLEGWCTPRTAAPAPAGDATTEGGPDAAL